MFPRVAASCNKDQNNDEAVKKISFHSIVK
jgi:hypothetical protein